MTDVHEIKYKEMQKYVPFIQRVIEKLKVNNDHQADNPRRAQLQKMEMLYDLLTNKHKKIKIETLTKCEGVLIKLQAKIEKQTTLLQNEDLVLSDIKLKQRTSCKASTSTKAQEIEDILGPASPPPEIIPDDIDQPVVIPTERRCSPILVKEPVKCSADKSQQQKKETYRLQDSQHSKSVEFPKLKNVSHSQNNTSKHHSSLDKSGQLHQRLNYDSGTSSPKDYHRFEETQAQKFFNPARPNSLLAKEKPVETNKSPATLGQMLQTVKVVITEPLPAHIQRQHFPTSNKNVPRSSICHSNLKTLPQATKTKEDYNEAYSPEELWDKYNNSYEKQSSTKTISNPTVFSRLGVKVPENSFPSCSTSKSSGRYTPIPDVLKSPPLSASDINNLLLESGADKALNDISEIGSRRPVKNEDNKKQSPNNSFEYVRKKLAQTAKISSPHSETPKLKCDTSPVPQERIALKYNPHPRHERLQSVSSTDGSECSTQSKVIDPRIKTKLQTSSFLRSPTQVAASNVNVLPAINLSDPRLKKQNTVSLTPERNSLPSNAPVFTPNLNMNQYPLNLGSRRNDPRVSHIPNSSPSIQPMPQRRLSTNQPQYSSEENWDSDEKETKQPPNKTDPRLLEKHQQKVESRYERNVGAREGTSPNSTYSYIRNINSNGRNTMSQPRFQSQSGADEVPLISSEQKPSTNVNAKHIQHKTQNLNKQNTQKDTPSVSKKSKNKLIPSTIFTVHNPPKSDTEEDWDSEQEITDNKTKSLPIDMPQLPINKLPVVPMTSPYTHTQISPKPFINPLHLSSIPVPPVHMHTHIPHPQSHYPMAGTDNLHHHQHSYITPNSSCSSSNNRFNSILNDKSERVKYFEAKKQKATEPRTYKEFREAKERAQAQEAAIKRAAEEAETKKKADELKESHKEKDLKENACDKKGQQTDTLKKAEQDKKTNKPHKDNKKPLVVESTLDKMYRTQNFNSKFPKANKSFKIPKKKTEEKPKEEGTKINETPAQQTENSFNDNQQNKMKSNQTEPITAKKKSISSQDLNEKGNNNNYGNNELKAKQNEQLEINLSDKTEENQEQQSQSSKDNLTKNVSASNNKSIKDDSKDKQKITEDISNKTSPSNNQNEKTTKEKQQDAKENGEDKLNENNIEAKLAGDDLKLNVRDPRCRSKLTQMTTKEDEEENEKGQGQEQEQEHDDEHGEKLKRFGDIVITSSESQVVLKPQQNLDKFNKLTLELPPKPQRILRRRNTMVVFDSAPLVDKEKLKAANARLFEDLQEDERRKRKQAEEDRLNARRNKHLEEMFKKTDDNCTVSTQNIITGKRRTRATINFNETVNAINVFKHKTIKDSSLVNATTTTPTIAPAIKPAKTNFKIKLRNIDLSDRKINESDEEDNSEALARKAIKMKNPLKVNKEAKGVTAKSCKENKTRDESQTEEADTECKTNAKLAKKRTPVKTVTANTEQPTKFFKPIRNDEHQNCAVSSTSTDNYNVEETTCSSVSTNRSFKKESDDNEPTSTAASKSNNPTPTTDPNRHVLNEIVDHILKPNADREQILGVLGQILSEERLELIKSLIESCNRQQEDQHEIGKDETDKQRRTEESNEARISVDQIKTPSKNEARNNIKEDEYEEEEREQPIKLTKSIGGKKMTLPKKKRSELDRLNEDIRDMFICEGVLTATGRRMCTIMGKDVEPAAGSKKSTKEFTPTPTSEPESTNKRKEEMNKPSINTRSLRRSTRCCKTIEDNEDDEAQSTYSRTDDDSVDDFNTDNSTATDATPLRRMPVLKPHTPIKMPEEVLSKAAKAKEPTSKRKADSKFGPKAKKFKVIKHESKEDSDSEKESETGVGTGTDVLERKGGEAEGGGGAIEIMIKNTNVHWHNQSKYTTWCMICEKRILANLSSLHYKTHHRENYISRMAPVLLQQFKQGKLNQPLFGVKKAQRQPSWFYRCPFCLKYFNTPMPLWLEHFQNHTVEFRYECSKCHRCSNRKLTVARHIKSCEGATILTSAVKLSVPTAINAHVCHLCNFIQLKRVNLERHYIEQHQLERKTVDLLGYTIKLFDVENVECVAEENAIERENEAWKSIEKDEQVIDIDDDEESSSTPDQQHSTTVRVTDATACNDELKEKETERIVVEGINKEKENEKGLELSRDKENELNKVPDERSVILQQTEDSVGKKIENKKEAENRSQTENFDKVSNSEKSNENTQEKETKDAVSTQKTNQTEKTQQKTNKTKALQTDKKSPQEQKKEEGVDINVSKSKHEKYTKNKNSVKERQDRKNNTNEVWDLTETETDSNDFEVIKEKNSVQDIQDELLELAAKAAEKEDENQKHKKIPQTGVEAQTSKEVVVSTSNQEVANESTKTTSSNSSASKQQTTMFDIISNSIDMIYNRTCGSTDNKNNSNSIDAEPSETEMPVVYPTASNVFMPTRDENNFSPTIQILAQSIINIEEQGNESIKDKPITMAERLSQRFKSLQNETSAAKSIINQPTSNSNNKSSKENAIEKLIDDTLLELTKVRDGASDRSSSIQNPTGTPFIAESHKENVFDRFFSETVLEIQNDKDNESGSQIMQLTETGAGTGTETRNLCKDVPPPNTGIITVISDDEDWEDIEITESAPTNSATSAGNTQQQKSKNKGLFQKFGIFKGNNTKSKKHLPPLVYLPKKKTKEKSLQSTTLPPHSPITTTITATATTEAINKVNEITTTNSLSNSNAHLGFKPFINIMDGLFPDSPSNDPIDLVPELAPLEPLQDLNDISSILDSNLSAVNINAADNHASIEDALDFISEQQANDAQQQSNIIALKSLPSQAKTTISNISHVGFSVQTGDENAFKFYCLLQNCSFLYSSDSMGLETHFMCEHSQIKWNGYCLMCQSQCFPNADVGEEHSISKEIRHMMEKHANKAALDLNTDSTQHSTTSSQDNEERPKIKIRRLTGDCLSRATPENVPSSSATESNDTTTNTTTSSMSMLGALLVAEPKPPTKEMPPQPQMPLTEPLLLDNKEASPQVPFTNNSSDFRITSVTSAACKPFRSPLQITRVISMNKSTPAANEPEQVQIPKISNVRTLAPKAGSLWSQQIEKDRLELAEAVEESLEVSRILANAARPNTQREIPEPANDSPVLVAETVPLAQSKTGDFVVTQTVSAQYNEFSSTALGFNISIAASKTSDNTNTESIPTDSTVSSIASRQYKCMGSSCKFVSRVPVAMSDHLRFHERRNFSNKRDYLSCGFCFYCATDVEDYMKHANQFHMINKGAAATPYATNTSETDTANSLTKKIQNILNSSHNSGGNSRYSVQTLQKNQTTQVKDTQEMYLKKLRETIDEIVGPTGLADDKLYRCVIKNCHSQLTESTFLSHIMFHITTTGGNPNNYIFKCPHCSAQYHRPAGIKAHIKNHARNRYFCYLCDETTTNPGQLLKHFSDKHWHTLNMYTKELLKPKISTDGSESVLDSSYFVAYTQDLSTEEVKKFGEKLILEWQRKKSGSKTHFKSTEIDLLPLSAIFQREVNCGECEYKTKVRTNMFRHLLMHKQNPDSTNKSGVSQVCSVDPINPVPCLNSAERFFDKMTNLASSSLIPSSSSSASSTTKSSFKIPYVFIEEIKRYTCGCQGCNYIAISEDLFRTHLSTLHSTAMTYNCIFCQEEICKRGITIDRIMNHTRFHGVTIHRCEECNYVHHLRYVVERHINEKHAVLKVNIVTHNRSTEDSSEGCTSVTPFAGKKYKETAEINQAAQSTAVSESFAVSKPVATYVNSAKGKGKWFCDMCGNRATTLSQMQTHCQQQHGVKNQYKCAHCNFGSQQLSQILHHIDDKHSGKTREARYMYHKIVNSGDDAADTRPLWQRNDPTRIRHIRGILMEDEEESEEYRKKLALSEDVDDDDSNEDQQIATKETDGGDENVKNYILGYEFGCYHCSFKTQAFEELKDQHYAQVHNSQLETAKPFWYCLHMRLCCPECCLFIGNYKELHQHLRIKHNKTRFYAADVKMAETDDTSQRIMCGFCSFHCANADNLYRHHQQIQHFPKDIRIEDNTKIMEILALGKAELSYQCTLCADIFPNKVATVHHACNSHAGENSFSFRELANTLIYRCNWCCFTSTTEMELLRHAINHYNRFKICLFCRKPQDSFNVYMQHCYAEHKNEIKKFKTIYPLLEIKKFLMHSLVVFPSGLVVSKRNLRNTKYGSDICIENFYEEIYKISQQPPIPRLSIARLVARKSIEAQQKHVDNSPSSSLQDQILDAIQPRPVPISKRRCTVAFSHEDHHTSDSSLREQQQKLTKTENKAPAIIGKRRTTVDLDQQQQFQEKDNEFSAPLQPNKISKRRRTVAVDRETLFSSNLLPSTNSLLVKIESAGSGKKRKSSSTHSNLPSPKHIKETHALNLDMEPFSFYGQTPETPDLSKIYTKVAIGGIKTPLTIDKFRLLFNIDCQLKLTKCDADGNCKLLVYNDYKHVKMACPASHKPKFN